jgi:hypothetical protein
LLEARRATLLVVCDHVVQRRAAVFRVDLPDENAGLIVCCDCAKIPLPLKSIAGFCPVCIACAQEQGWTESVH